LPQPPQYWYKGMHQHAQLQQTFLKACYVLHPVLSSAGQAKINPPLDWLEVCKASVFWTTLNKHTSKN
jgi:hypothetical protein